MRLPARAGRLLAGLLGTALVLGAIPAAEARSKEVVRETGNVTRVIDGDTFDMADATGVVKRVRVTGIQAPEKSWCGGKAARTALQKLLPVGTAVRLASRKAGSGNAPTGVWRIKRTVYREVDGQWVNIAPGLLSSGTVFPFPFIGEDAHNTEYLTLAWRASQEQVGLYEPERCGASKSKGTRLRLEVLADGPGPDTADSEFVMVFNGSAKQVDIAGWMIQDTSPLNAFFFPKGATLRPDDYVVVYSGTGTNGVAPDGSKDPRFFYAATGVRWNNGSTDIAFLFDDAGKDRTGNLREWQIIAPAR